MRRLIGIMLLAGLSSFVAATPSLAGYVRALQFDGDGNLLFSLRTADESVPNWNDCTSCPTTYGLILKRDIGEARFREIYAMLLAADLNEKKVTIYSNSQTGTRNDVYMIYLHE